MDTIRYLNYIPDEEFTLVGTVGHLMNWNHAQRDDFTAKEGYFEFKFVQGDDDVDVQWVTFDPLGSLIIKPQLSSGTTHTIKGYYVDKFQGSAQTPKEVFSKTFTKVSLDPATKAHVTVARFEDPIRLMGYLHSYTSSVSQYTIANTFLRTDTGELMFISENTAGVGNPQIQMPTVTLRRQRNFNVSTVSLSGLYTFGSPGKYTVVTYFVNPTSSRYVVAQDVVLSQPSMRQVGGFYPLAAYKKEQLLLLEDIDPYTHDGIANKVVSLPFEGTINVGKGVRPFSTSKIVNGCVAIDLLATEVSTGSNLTVTLNATAPNGFSTELEYSCALRSSLYKDPTSSDVFVEQVRENLEEGIVHELFQMVTFPAGYQLFDWQVFYKAQMLSAAPDYGSNIVKFMPPSEVDKNTTFEVFHKLTYYREADGTLVDVVTTADAIYSFDPPLNIIATDKYLYKKADGYYTEDEAGNLKKLEVTQLNDLLFYEHGVNTFKESHLTNGTTLVYYKADAPAVAPKISYGGTYQGCIVKMDWDLQAEQGTAFNLMGDIRTNDNVRFLFSNDSGTTWKTYHAGSIKEVPLSEIATTGTTHEALQGLTKEQIKLLRGSTNKLRLAIYVEQYSVKQMLNIRHIRLRF